VDALHAGAALKWHARCVWADPPFKIPVVFKYASDAPCGMRQSLCSGQSHAAYEYTAAAGSSTAVVSLIMVALPHDHTRRSAATCPACVNEQG
jgi:hypothetical protein